MVTSLGLGLRVRVIVSITIAPKKYRPEITEVTIGGRNHVSTVNVEYCQYIAATMTLHLAHEKRNNEVVNPNADTNHSLQISTKISPIQHREQPTRTQPQTVNNNIE